ncbi:hypothetical protein QQP08_006924 [Theobroma cacao]|nr:hypothetical protein QQP08_006924 [Theobroma cacao]
MEDTTVVYLTLSTIILLLCFKLSLKPRASSKNLPPSPPSLLILGHLHLIKPPIHRVDECFTINNIILANNHKFLVDKHLEYNYTIMIVLPYGDLLVEPSSHQCHEDFIIKPP